MPVVGDLWRQWLIRPDHSDDIKPAAAVHPLLLFEEHERGPRHPPLFVPIDGVHRLPVRDTPARLHFHEDNRVTIEGNQIEFAADVAMLPAQNSIAKLHQISLGGELATLAQRPCA